VLLLEMSLTDGLTLVESGLAGSLAVDASWDWIWGGDGGKCDEGDLNALDFLGSDLAL
jgi:hypothetical protein